MSLTAPGPEARWIVAVHISIGLWIAMVVGNVALYSVRPAGHWPALECVEALQVASLLPVALLLDRLHPLTPAMRFVIVIGLIAIAVGFFIDLGFAVGLLRFGEGLLGGPAYIGGWVLLLAWLLAANLVSLRDGAVPRSLALLGIGAALTATLLYPWWRIRLARTVDPHRRASRASA